MDITYYKKYEPIFGSWHIVREIGEGSFGKVFEIERNEFGRTYKAALKAITVPQSQSEVKSVMADGFDRDSVTAYFRGFVEEMVDEFALMSQLKGHSNIVSYEDHIVMAHGEDVGWDILIRMELLTPLVDWVQEHPLSVRDTVKLGIDMCRALEACRKCSIVHRDIKPENIFVSKLGDFKLGDFGIAKTVEKTMGGMSKKGTYTYMAPEVYKGEEYGASVDIYSLGIVLYRYLNNNRAPFYPADAVPSYKTREDALYRRLRGDEMPAPANADKALADIILKACAYNPKDRFSSPTEMRKALEALAETTNVKAEPAAALPEIEETVVISTSAETVAEEPLREEVLPETVSEIEETAVVGTSEETVAEEPLREETLPKTVPEIDETVVIGSSAASEETVVMVSEGTDVLEPEKEAATREEKPAPKKKNRKLLIIAVLALVAAVVVSIITKCYPHAESVDSLYSAEGGSPVNYEADAGSTLIAHYGWFNNLEYAEVVNYSEYGTETTYYNSDIESIFKVEWRDSGDNLRLVCEKNEGASKDLTIYNENGQIIRSFSADWDAERFSLGVECAGGHRPSEFSWIDNELGSVHGQFDENYNLIYLEYWETGLLVYFSESGDHYSYNQTSSEYMLDASEYDYLQFDYPGADEAEYRDVTEYYSDGEAFMCVLREGWEEDAPPVAVIHYESGEIRTLLYRYDDGYGWVF